MIEGSPGARTILVVETRNAPRTVAAVLGAIDAETPASVGGPDRTAIVRETLRRAFPHVHERTIEVLP
jgi:hypothetical protein